MQIKMSRHNLNEERDTEFEDVRKRDFFYAISVLLHLVTAQFTE